MTHNYLDGLTKKCTITYQFYFRQVQLQFRENLFTCGYRRFRIPVIVQNGPVLIPEFYFDNYFIPETLSESITHFGHAHRLEKIKRKNYYRQHLRQIRKLS